MLDDAISFDLGYRSVIGILAQVSNEGSSGTSAKEWRELTLVAAHAVGLLKLLQRVSAWKNSKRNPGLPQACASSLSLRRTFPVRCGMYVLYTYFFSFLLSFNKQTPCYRAELSYKPAITSYLFDVVWLVIVLGEKGCTVQVQGLLVGFGHGGRQFYRKNSPFPLSLSQHSIQPRPRHHHHLLSRPNLPDPHFGRRPSHKGGRLCAT